MCGVSKKGGRRMKRFATTLKTTTIAFAAVAMVASSAMATEGMFGNGTGARNKALAGAGVADQNDATAMSLNPAGLIHSENQLNVAASLFSPWRGYEWAGGGQDVDSNSNYFVIPNIAYSHRVDANTVFGLSMYGNGGMNTDYPAFANGGCPPGGTGLGCLGTAGIDLQQMFISAGLAKQYGNFSVGVAPIVAIQIFKADGLMNPYSGTVFSESTDVAVGIGIRGGVEWAITPGFRVAAAGTSPTYMQSFNKYKDLFAAGETAGELRLPASIQAGVAFDLMSGFTVMADYKRIFYSGVDAIGKPTSQGGFGWDDINVYKVGIEWDVNPGLTLRAGYAYNDQPIPAESVQANWIAPGVVQHHITGGAQIKMSDSIDLELAGMYAPKETVTGPAFAPVGGPPPTPTPAGNTSIHMYQWELTAGIKWKLGQ